MDERELVKRCLGGNADAWGELVERFSGLIYWAIKRKLNKCDLTYLISDVEDIYQRLFASIWEKKSLLSVSDRGNIAPWLVVLASNFTVSFIREKQREENFLHDTDSAEVPNAEADVDPDWPQWSIRDVLVQHVPTGTNHRTACGT